MKNREKVPQGVWEALEYEIARDGMECDDNWRAYRVSDDFLFEEFVDADKRGCCGSFQTTVTVGGDKWIVGCNYGH